MKKDPTVDVVEAAEALPPEKARAGSKRELLRFDADLKTIVASAEVAAAYFGVTKQTLSNWVSRDGCPKLKYGFYDIKAVTEHRRRIESLAGTPEEEKDVEKMSLAQQKLYYEQKYKAAKAESAELDTAIMRGEYLKRDKVTGELKSFAAILKRSLQGLGGKLSREVSSCVGAEEARRLDRLITGTIDDALTQLSVKGAYSHDGA